MGNEEIEEEIGKALEQAKELQDAAASFINGSASEEQSLRDRAQSLDSLLRRLKSSLRSRNLLDPKLEEDLERASCILIDGDAASFVPAKPQGRFLRMFLGPINVRAARKDIQLKVKEEYNSYRDCPSVSSFPINATYSKILDLEWMLAGIPSSTVSGLALRENILRANGSDIRPWTSPKYLDKEAHKEEHKISEENLTWEIKGEPNCSQKQRGVQLFLQWALMQGIAMLLQNRYQRQRLYTRIALGKAKRMDVVWGETAGVSGQLLVLCPILFILQGFEAYVGLLLLRTALDGVVSEWQVIFCGILLVLMAVGNFENTVETLMAKSRFKAKMKRSKSKQEL
ncbi:hypothetical protein TIFTF001_018663 [Ficus carica]|uniref:Uncharacterized protein n=1 Tax=Ficus carica TaxID=3494 RepID=A0AA88A7G5_FICCA|nr:hypothetical protein TIFTF001_018663 [Ficus carica]